MASSRSERETDIVAKARDREPSFANWYWGLLDPMRMCQEGWLFAKAMGQQLKYLSFFVRGMWWGSIAGALWAFGFGLLPSHIDWMINTTAVVLGLGVVLLYVMLKIFRMTYCKLYVIERNDRRRRDWYVTALGECYVPRLPFLYRPECFVGAGMKSGVLSGDIRLELSAGEWIEEVRHLRNLYTAHADKTGMQEGGAMLMYDHYNMHSLSGELITLLESSAVSDFIKNNWGLLVLAAGILFLMVSQLMPSVSLAPSDAGASPASLGVFMDDMVGRNDWG